MAAELKNATAFNAKLWRFDLMTLSECFLQAEADAADADVMVVAFGPDEPVPPKLFQWLGDWAEHRHIRDAALGVLPTGAATRQIGLKSVAALRSLARRHGLGFICPEEPIKPGGLAAPVRHLDRWEEMPSPAQFISPSQNVPLSEWGINE